jgi:hypothetical protein
MKSLALTIDSCDLGSAVTDMILMLVWQQEHGGKPSPAMSLSFRLSLWWLILGNLAVIIFWQKVHSFTCIVYIVLKKIYGSFILASWSIYGVQVALPQSSSVAYTELFSLSLCYQK